MNNARSGERGGSPSEGNPHKQRETRKRQQYYFNGTDVKTFENGDIAVVDPAGREVRMSETGQPAGLPTVPEEVPATPIEPVIPLCETCATRCGGYLLSNAPCSRKQDRGCLLLENRRYKLVDGEARP